MVRTLEEHSETDFWTSDSYPEYHRPKAISSTQPILVGRTCSAARTAILPCTVFPTDWKFDFELCQEQRQDAQYINSTISTQLSGLRDSVESLLDTPVYETLKTLGTTSGNPTIVRTNHCDGCAVENHDNATENCHESKSRRSSIERCPIRQLCSCAKSCTLCKANGVKPGNF